MLLKCVLPESEVRSLAMFNSLPLRRQIIIRPIPLFSDRETDVVFVPIRKMYPVYCFGRERPAS